MPEHPHYLLITGADLKWHGNAVVLGPDQRAVAVAATAYWVDTGRHDSSKFVIGCGRAPSFNYSNMSAVIRGFLMFLGVPKESVYIPAEEQVGFIPFDTRGECRQALGTIGLLHANEGGQGTIVQFVREHHAPRAKVVLEKLLTAKQKKSEVFRDITVEHVQVPTGQPWSLCARVEEKFKLFHEKFLWTPVV